MRPMRRPDVVKVMGLGVLALTLWAMTATAEAQIVYSRSASGRYTVTRYPETARPQAGTVPALQPLAAGVSTMAPFPNAPRIGTYSPYYTGYYSGFESNAPSPEGLAAMHNLTYPYVYSPAPLYRNFGGWVYPNTPGQGAAGYGGFGYPMFWPYKQYYGVGPGMQMYRPYVR